MSLVTRSLARWVLWAFVIAMGIGVGAGLYEARVITPLWSASPPESVAGWRALLAANPQYAPHGGDDFWVFVTPTRALLGILLLVTATRVTGQHRQWRLVAGVLTLALFAIAALWLIPTSQALFASEGPPLSPDRIVALTRDYVRLNYVFQGLGIAAFLAGLRALSLDAMPGDSNERKATSSPSR